MGCICDGSEVADQAEDIRRLHHHTGCLIIDQCGDIFGTAGRYGAADHGADQAGNGFHCLGIMGVQPAREDRLAALGDALSHQHRFRCRGGTVIKRGIRHIHARQQRNLGLEFEQILERALRDFRLIGRVAGEKFRALDQVIHRTGHMMLVGARTAEKWRRARRHVFCGQPGQCPLDFQLALRVRQIEGRQGHQRRLGHITEQDIHFGRTDPVQHGAAVIGGQGKITHKNLSHGWPARALPAGHDTF